MIIITGGAGFIGSAMAWELNRQGVRDILVVDNLGSTNKWRNLVGLKYHRYIHKDEFLGLTKTRYMEGRIEAVIHMGACSATTEPDCDYLVHNNLEYSKTLCRFALERDARFIYASSAATYGDGSRGFDDSDEAMEALQPLNMYGYSKHLFDLWLKGDGLLDKVAGLKFFNVFGPNEYHKDDMRSVVCKAFTQIRQTGKLKLFKSYRQEYAHGEQRRDFVYIKDCVRVIDWLLKNRGVGGVFNVGTGQARTWNDLARSVFAAMGRETQVEYVDMPDALRGKYQYYTCADLKKLAGRGCDVDFRPLEDGIADYVQNYLMHGYAHMTSRY
ncbi:MAG TPA: ADP-glyceromanno-heptose 6-epimerase [Desulfovibrio sp.]|nr:ADP-glyceromanno-heptose 6-epimerase [Desulfovibrio sp.]